MTLSRYAAKARSQSMDKNNPKRYKRGSGAAQAYDKLNRGDYSEEVELEEKLKPSMGAGEYVKDFQKSDAPQFQDKSKEKRRQMAIAAYLAAKRK